MALINFLMAAIFSGFLISMLKPKITVTGRVKWLILLGCSLPYPFLGMYGDIEIATLLLYDLLIINTIVFCWLSGKTRNVPYAITGNLISVVVSCLCVMLFQDSKWEWYFKPFTPMGLAITIWGFCFVLALIYWWLTRPVKTETSSKQE